MEVVISLYTRMSVIHRAGMDQLLVVTPTPKNTPSVLRTLCRENNYGVSIVACSRVLESLQKKLEQVENENAIHVVSRILSGPCLSM